MPDIDRVVTPPVIENAKTVKWRLAMNVVAQAWDRSVGSDIRESGSSGGETRGLRGPDPEQLLESRVHAVERIPSESRGKAAQFIPIRFIFRNKLTKDDKVLLAAPLPPIFSV